jgi:hypothetical protein
MKLPDFNRDAMEWDSWQAFHIDLLYHAFVQFDTGEFVVCNNSWRPENRKVYSKLHIQIVATDDDECPKLYTPGMASVVGAKPIPKSHLNHHGQQTLLLDLDSKRAVSLYPGLTKENAPLVPERFTKSNRCTVWYAGPDAVPVGAPVTRHYPQPLTFDQRTHIKELEDASKVWLQMQPDPAGLQKQHGYTKMPVRDFVDVSFGVLTPEHRTAIAVSGFYTIVKEVHPWLTFNIEGVTDE